MELKYIKMLKDEAKKKGSNCTFMELKFGKRLSAWVRIHCSNCTFMELKSMVQMLVTRSLKF